MPRTKRRRPRRGSSLPPNVCRHRGRYRGKVMLDGRSHVGPSFATPEEAAEWVRQLRDVGAASGPATLAAVMDLRRKEMVAAGNRPATIKIEEERFRTICKAWPETTAMHRIGAPQIVSYLAHRREKDGLSSQTLHHEWAFLKRLFLVAKRNRRLHSSPFDNKGILPPKVQSKRFDYLPRAQVDAMLARVRDAAVKRPAWAWDADLFEFTFLTGLRRSEIARLRVADVDLFKAMVLVMAKTENQQTVPLSERARDVAARLVAAAGENGFLVRSKSDTEQSRVERISNVMRAWKDRLGLKLHGGLHVLRHSFATAGAESGVGQLDLQRAGRWKTLSMVSRYYHQSEDRLRAVFEGVAQGAVPQKPRKPRKPSKRRAAKDASA